MGLRPLDMGNNEVLSTGYTKNSDGRTYTALSLCESKSDFKTKRGAIAWLAKRGYDENGYKVR